MPKQISIQSTIPAAADRPSFAEWFSEIKYTPRNPVYDDRLNMLYRLRCVGVNAKLITITNKRCHLVIVGVAIGEDEKTKVSINKY